MTFLLVYIDPIVGAICASVFLNIVNKKNMIKRLKLRKSLNRYDKFDNNFYQKVQKGFMRLAKIKNKKYTIVNSNLDISYNKSLILNKIDKLI